MIKILALTVLLLVVINEIKSNTLPSDKKLLERKPHNQRRPQKVKGVKANGRIGNAISNRNCTRTRAQCLANEGKPFITKIGYNVSFPIPPGAVCNLLQFGVLIVNYTIVPKNQNASIITIQYTPFVITTAPDGSQVSHVQGNVTAGLCTGNTVSVETAFPSCALETCNAGPFQFSTTISTLKIGPGGPCYGSCSGIDTFTFT